MLFVATFITVVLSFIGFGVGVLFFGKTASREACGKIPELNTEACLSQQAGICPIEDRSGALKVARFGKISYSKLDKHA